MYLVLWFLLRSHTYPLAKCGLDKAHGHEVGFLGNGEDEVGTVVEVVELNPFEGTGARVAGEVESVGGEESTFLVEERAGDGDVENGVHLYQILKRALGATQSPLDKNTPSFNADTTNTLKTDSGGIPGGRPVTFISVS